MIIILLIIDSSIRIKWKKEEIFTGFSYLFFFGGGGGAGEEVNKKEWQTIA